MSSSHTAGKSNLDDEGKGTQRQELTRELDVLEAMIEQLRIRYEQHFMGALPIAPIKEHDTVKRKIRELIRAPFKSSAVRYRLRMLEGRYQTYNTYWERTLKKREEGTYSKDVFKADLREKRALEEAHAASAKGVASKQMIDLYNSYREALRKVGKDSEDLDVGAFQRSLMNRAKDLKTRYGVEKVRFKVQVKDGKVSLQAKGEKK